MWTATRDLKHEKLNVTAGMPIPRQQHRSYLRQVRSLFGEDCMEWKPGVSQVDVSKANLRISILERDNKRLRAKLGLKDSTEEAENSQETADLKRENEILKANASKTAKNLDAATTENALLLKSNESLTAHVESLTEQLAECRKASKKQKK